MTDKKQPRKTSHELVKESEERIKRLARKASIDPENPGFPAWNN